ncbi:hypothetical protein [Brevibacillus borstelensis]|nr:hypothetical protein [Brevibacillus borstelensis]MCM3473288.1 hypothetical protein [Brevibacillus borstelensis]
MRNLFLFFIFTCLFVTAGCVKNDNLLPDDSIKEQTLKIGVIGQSPAVTETNIVFTETTFEKLSNATDTDFDALFIMPEKLEEASHGQYAKLYKSVKYPVFFIGSTKSYYPFTEETLTYSNAPSTHSGMYATGMIYEDGQIKIFEYGLKNGEKTEENLKALYTNIFKTIINEFVLRKTSL